jgi:hypothetical protein
MIKIGIATRGKLGEEEIIDEFEMKDASLGENALVIRSLEEMKLKLLQIEYDCKFKIEDENVK